MDWPESTIELPDDPRDAIQLIEDILSDEASMKQRRNRNVIEALERHDTRYRLRDLFVDLKLPLPSHLQNGLAELNRSSAAIRAMDNT